MPLPHGHEKGLGTGKPREPDELMVMKRRTLRQTRAAVNAAAHHRVYVVLLDPAVARSRRVLKQNPSRDPEKPCVYVGMTGLALEERFRNHKNGVRASHYVKRYGKTFLPELFEYLNPMPYEQAQLMEHDLAEDLRNAGYTVTGGY